MVIGVNFVASANHMQEANSCDLLLLSLLIFSFALSCMDQQIYRLICLFTVRGPSHRAGFPFTQTVARRHLYLCVCLSVCVS